MCPTNSLTKITTEEQWIKLRPFLVATLALIHLSPPLMDPLRAEFVDVQQEATRMLGVLSAVSALKDARWSEVGVSMVLVVVKTVQKGPMPPIMLYHRWRVRHVHPDGTRVIPLETRSVTYASQASTVPRKVVIWTASTACIPMCPTRVNFFVVHRARNQLVNLPCSQLSFRPRSLHGNLL